jgi:hypothetical protein
VLLSAAARLTARDVVLDNARQLEMKPDRPAFEELRRVMVALSAGRGTIVGRLEQAWPHFSRLERADWQNRTELALWEKVVTSLMEASSVDESANDDDDDDRWVQDAFRRLSEADAVKIAADMLSLFEVVADIDDRTHRLGDGVKFRLGWPRS